jgi:hypothetical protein
VARGHALRTQQPKSEPAAPAPTPPQATQPEQSKPTSASSASFRQNSETPSLAAPTPPSTQPDPQCKPRRKPPGIGMMSLFAPFPSATAIDPTSRRHSFSCGMTSQFHVPSPQPQPTSTPSASFRQNSQSPLVTQTHQPSRTQVQARCPAPLRSTHFSGNSPSNPLFSVDTVALVLLWFLRFLLPPWHSIIAWNTIVLTLSLESQASAKTPRFPPPLRASALKLTASTFRSPPPLLQRPSSLLAL